MKLYYRMHEVSKITKLPASKIRAWEKSICPLHSSRAGLNRTGYDSRRFNDADIQKIMVIKGMKENKGLTNKGVIKELKEINLL